MAGGIIATSGAKERAHMYHDKLTWTAFFYSFFIAQAGFLFGYDLDKPLPPPATQLTLFCCCPCLHLEMSAL